MPSESLKEMNKRSKDPGLGGARLSDAKVSEGTETMEGEGEERQSNGSGYGMCVPLMVV